MSDPAGEAKAQVRPVLEKARDQFSEQASHLGDLATDARYHAEDFIQAKPWAAVGIAATIGLLVGFILGRR